MLTNCIAAEGWCFVPDPADPTRVTHVPAPPALMAGEEGSTGQTVWMFRKPISLPGDEDIGGAMVALALDLNPPSTSRIQAAASLPSSIAEIAPATLLPGEVAIWLGGTCIARIPSTGGRRPIVPVTFSVAPTFAILLREAINSGQSLISATVAAPLVLPGSMPQALRCEIDRDRAAHLLAQQRSLWPAAEILGVVPLLVEGGALRIENVAQAPKSIADEIGMAVATMIVGELFEPVFEDEAWSFAVGLGAKGFTPRGTLRVIQTRPGKAILENMMRNDLRVPWFAATRLRLTEKPTSFSLEDDGAFSFSVTVQIVDATPTSGIELQIEHAGETRRLSIDTAAQDRGDRRMTMRFPRKRGELVEYRWRSVVHGSDGTEAASDWVQASTRTIFLDTRSLGVKPSAEQGSG